MKKIILALTFAITLFILSGCTIVNSNSSGVKKTPVSSENNPTEEVTEETKVETEPVETPEPTNPSVTVEKTPEAEPTFVPDDVSGKDYYDEKTTAHLYYDLFDINNKIIINIEISDTEIAKIESDYQKYGSECNIYRLADSVTITIEYADKQRGTLVKTIEDVGIRMKGNTTRHSFYDSGITSLIHFKLDFQETFDDSTIYNSKEIKQWDDDISREYRKNRTFFGLRGLELKYNAEGDLTYTRDVYSSKVYRENGIMAQNMTVGVLDFNIGGSKNKSGTLGVYKIYEPVDRVFVKRNFLEGYFHRCIQ